MIIQSRSPDPLRPAPTWRQRLNVFWLLRDDLRSGGWAPSSWFSRNSFANAKAVVLGVCHLDRVVITTRSPWTWPAYGARGWNAGWTITAGWRFLFPLPFIAHRGARWEWCIGWKTSGSVTITWRRANSPNAGPTPD